MNERTQSQAFNIARNISNQHTQKNTLPQPATVDKRVASSVCTDDLTLMMFIAEARFVYAIVPGMMALHVQ